ncbi:MICOS complex subunit mic25a-like isoform X1 [Scomber scombrus]|uniref:MICOS complex subunit mic25a-like isoform X1 n=1 Tax=Scomber scombrus TaxID=13677 RepID=A0AAV1N809_SCOSC|nr:MICOS complex subunit mic25a-like [Scomber scombrus]
MGSGESTTRKVSFGVDDEDRVRILRGVKLSEDVLQRMRGVANIAPERTPSPSPTPTPTPTSTSTSPKKDTGASRSASSSSQPQQSPQHRAQPGSQSSSSKPASYAKEEQRRYERQQTKLKEEMDKMAQREREERSKTMSRERQQRQEAEKANQLAQQLQRKDSQLKALDAFYKEQLAQLEKRNLERFQSSKEQFHEAASNTEVNVRSRSTDPVCSGLQAQILSCYRGNREQTLKCADLAKEYMRCINAAKKNLLVNHG